MKYDLFLFDLDDTLLDFGASERKSFFSTLEHLGVQEGLEPLFAAYQRENLALWQSFERGEVSKDDLKVTRFRNLFAAHQLKLDAEFASAHYLNTLPQTVVLIDHAVELCQWLSERGELGIITNGIHAVQIQRIANSPLAPYISFISVSESCGYAKPDARFFAHTVKQAKQFDKARTLIVGDRLEADIQGGHNFGIDSCWYNPNRLSHGQHPAPTHEIAHLSELRKLVA